MRLHRTFVPILALCLVAVSFGGARAASQSTGGVPNLDVKGSCNDAQKFASQGSDKNSAFKGCMQDEMNAKDQLAKTWSKYKPADKQTCVEQARAPSPSYVEVLTCLEMNTPPDNAGRNPPAIGGAQAPGLTNTPTPSAPPAVRAPQ